MAEDGLRALERELGASPPSGLSVVGSTRLMELTEAIRATRDRQAAELDAAGEHALSHLPRLLRGAVRKVLG